MSTSLVIASLVEVLAAALSPAEAGALAQLHGRPLPAVLPLAEPVYSSIAYGAGDAPFPIFMNRHGGNYNCGDNDSRTNSSTIACSGGSGNVGAWPGSDTEWASFMDCAVDLFSRFNIEVTDVEPSSGDYVGSLVVPEGSRHRPTDWYLGKTPHSAAVRTGERVPPEGPTATEGGSAEEQGFWPRLKSWLFDSPKK